MWTFRLLSLAKQTFLTQPGLAKKMIREMQSCPNLFGKVQTFLAKLLSVGQRDAPKPWATNVNSETKRVNFNHHDPRFLPRFTARSNLGRARAPW